MGNEVGEDPSRRVSQTTGCFQKALEGSWKGQRGQSSGIESKHQGRDGRPGARGQRDTDTRPPRPNPPPSHPWVCASCQFYSQNTSSYIYQLYLNSNIVCVCVCAPRIPAPPLPPQSPPSSKPHHLPPAHSTCPSHWPLPSWPALSTALRSCRNPAKPCQSLCLSYSDPSPAPQFSPVSAPPTPRLLSSASLSPPLSPQALHFCFLSLFPAQTDQPQALALAIPAAGCPSPRSPQGSLTSFRAVLKWHLPRDATWNGPTGKAATRFCTFNAPLACCPWC